MIGGFQVPPLQIEVFAEPGEVLRVRKLGWFKRQVVLDELVGKCVSPDGSRPKVQIDPWDSNRVRVRVAVVRDDAGEMLDMWLRLCESKSLPGLPSTAVVDDASSDLFGFDGDHGSGEGVFR